ncbi:ANTAR domain-containing protein [Diaphorobacter sp. HDW4B]|uniref:nitrate regulatory protein n=1 Tax=Diaphorobacter sp. HDW4B TaxID=2714925 RepID=UPI00140C1369|nr:nitrate regulatory protein [Diaphorobacter sp. HDW4B]QIL70970.1 ANTAR domain-containing protein [Diaphorobacter sp. HDW4B]
MKSSLRYLVAARQSEMAELEQIHNACALVTRVSGLIHQLQKERGLSNLLLASAGVQGATALAEQKLAVDAAIAAVRSELEANQELSLPGRHAARLFNAIAYLLQGLDALPALRQNVQTLAPTPQECMAAFVRLISGCMALVFEAADSACDPDISRLLVAMFHFMQGKELAGLERATGAAVFASGVHDAARQRHWLHLIDSQEQCFLVFADFAPPAIYDQWLVDSERCPDIATIERLRRVACTALPDDALEAALGERWFAACTLRLDAMHVVEGRLAEALAQLCAAKLEIARSALQALLEEQGNEGKESKPGGKKAPRGEPVADMGFFTAPMPGSLLAPATYGPRLERSVLGLVQEQSQRLQTMQAEIDRARTALNERKTLERAKGVLMNLRQMSESDAHKLMRQTAMNQNRRMLDVAEAVLSTADLLPRTDAGSKV